MPRVLVRATECAHAHTRHEHSGACRCPLHACSSRCQACTCTTCNEHVGMSTASAGRMQDGSAEQRQRRHGEERPAPTESERASRRRRQVVKCSGERKKERSPVHPKKRTFTRPKERSPALGPGPLIFPREWARRPSRTSQRPARSRRRRASALPDPREPRGGSPTSRRRRR